MKAQESSNPIPQFTTLDDRINKAMLQQKLCLLKVIWQFFPYSRLNDPTTSKAYQSLRFCQDNIPFHSEGSCYTACSRICQNGQVKKTSLWMTLHSSRSFSHLHQAHDTFLHAGTARSCKEDDWQLMLCRILKEAGNLLTNNHSHGSHDKVRIHDPKGRFVTFYQGGSSQNGLI